MRSSIPRWRPWVSWYSTFSRGFYSVNHPFGCYPPECLLHPQRTERMAVYAPRRRQRPRLFRLRYAFHGRSQHDPDVSDAIGSDDSPINYVATLAAFLARLHPHKSELSPNKTPSEPRESNFWATSSLKMVSVLTMTKSPSCLACLCLRT